ncbi:MAG: ribonuclease H-like YkuK family protein [Clostridiales bacterium]|nr:ribonuclease H-like YkuK family protein [Clostridiales bacterium]
MFKTAQGQVMSVPDIAKKIFEFIMSDKTNSYEITVGTDSQNFDRTKMVEVIAVHRKGRGGTYFYNIEFVRRITNLKQKINEETSRSLLVANDLLDRLQETFLENDMLMEDLDVSFQIHCDIGRAGKTSVLIKEIVSWVTSQGYVCLIKPDSYAASDIADKYSK